MATYKAEQLELLKEVPIEKLGLQIKDLSCLKQEHVHTIGDLLKMNKNEMILLNAMGRLSIEHIEERLYSYVASVDAQKAEIKEPEVSQSSPNWDPIREHNKEEKNPIDDSILELDIRSTTYYALRSAQLPTIRSIISETREAISSKNRRLGEYAINEICEAIIKYASQKNIENEIKDYPLFSQQNEEVKITETNTFANKASQTVYNPFRAPISDLNIKSSSYHALKSADIKIVLDVLQNRKNYLEKEYPKITPEILDDIDKAIRRLTSDHGCLGLALSFPFFEQTIISREESGELSKEEQFEGEKNVSKLEECIVEILRKKKSDGLIWTTATTIAKTIQHEYPEIASSASPKEIADVLMSSNRIIKNDYYYQYAGEEDSLAVNDGIVAASNEHTEVDNYTEETRETSANISETKDRLIEDRKEPLIAEDETSTKIVNDIPGINTSDSEDNNPEDLHEAFDISHYADEGKYETYAELNGLDEKRYENVAIFAVPLEGRTRNLLKRHHIDTLSDLLRQNQASIEAIPGIGTGSFAVLNDFLQKLKNGNVPDVEPLYLRYSIDIDAVKDQKLNKTELNPKIAVRLERLGIFTVKQLMESNFATIESITGIGNSSVLVIENFIKSYKSNINRTRDNTSQDTIRKNVLDYEATGFDANNRVVSVEEEKKPDSSGEDRLSAAKRINVRDLGLSIGALFRLKRVKITSFGEVLELTKSDLQRICNNDAAYQEILKVAREKLETCDPYGSSNTSLIDVKERLTNCHSVETPTVTCENAQSNEWEKPIGANETLCLEDRKSVECIESTSRRYLRQDKEDFYNWLGSNLDYSEDQCSDIVNLLRKIERYAKGKTFIDSYIYDLNSEKLSELKESLSTDRDFLLMINEKKDKYLSSINTLIQYKESIGEAVNIINEEGNYSLLNSRKNVAPFNTSDDLKRIIDEYELKDSPDEKMSSEIVDGEELHSSVERQTSDIMTHDEGRDDLDTRYAQEDSTEELVRETTLETETTNEVEAPDLDDIPLCQLYEVNAEDFESVMLDSFDLSARVSNRFKLAGIITVSDLLEQSRRNLSNIRGFGQTCFKEVDNLLSEVKKGNYRDLEEAFGAPTFNAEIAPFIEDIKSGNFEFIEQFSLSKSSLEYAKKSKVAYEELGSQLVEHTLNNQEYAAVLCKVFSEYNKEIKSEKKVKELLSTIPEQLLDSNALKIINLFTDDENLSISLKALLKEDDDSLVEFFRDNSVKLLSNANSLNRLITWCKFDINAELEHFYKSIIKNERSLQVVQMRAKGLTLEQTGNAFNITRERVRQIEKKASDSFRRWQYRNGLVQHILLLLGEETGFSSSEVVDCLNAYGDETLFLLKTCKANNYYYDKQLDVFIVEDRSFLDKIQSYIDSLPDAFDESRIDSIINTAQEEYDYPKSMVLAVLNDNYKKTGLIYHRSRLTLDKLYFDILTRFFPNGIHAYSEQQKIRDIALNEYGIDLSDKSDHAIESVLVRISLLRGRGIYISRKNAATIPDGLASRIKDYINSSDSPVFMTNTLFSLFEDELLEAGIDNKYYLHGLLRDRFDDEWIFRKDYISKDAKFTSIGSSIVELIRKSPYPVSKEEIIRQFPGITDIVIVLATSDSNIINLFGEYIHYSKLHLSKTDISYLRNTLEEHLQDKGYCTGHELFNTIGQEYKELLSNNFITIPFSLFSLLEHLFANDYVFTRPFIARDNIAFEKPSEILKQIIEESEVIAMDEITSFAKDNRIQIYSQLEFFDSFNTTHLLLDGYNLASITYTGVDEKIAKEIEERILGEITLATPISQLKCISSLPTIKVQWNAWLIYSVLKKWSDKLRVFPSDNKFKKSYPIVALAEDVNEGVTFEDLSHDGTIHVADDLTNIDELIESYLGEELGDL